MKKRDRQRRHRARQKNKERKLRVDATGRELGLSASKKFGATAFRQVRSQPREY